MMALKSGEERVILSHFFTLNPNFGGQFYECHDKTVITGRPELLHSSSALSRRLSSLACEVLQTNHIME